MLKWPPDDTLMTVKKIFIFNFQTQREVNIFQQKVNKDNIRLRQWQTFRQSFPFFEN
jgi:hypothetical protein